MSEPSRHSMPLTCHGHSRPVPHLSFSRLENDTFYMISACKDGNPMLRDGQTGDWIGTFLGHKGAVWQAKVSPDTTTVATASADFTAKIWDTHTGELLYILQHDHIVRAVAYPYDNSTMVVTGGFEKKLRLFDLLEARPLPSPTGPTPSGSGNGTDNHNNNNNNNHTNTNNNNTNNTNTNNDGTVCNGNGAGNTNPAVEPMVIDSARSFEIGEGVHQEPIKFIVWAPDHNIIITAAGQFLRWFNLSERRCAREKDLGHEIKSCELVFLVPPYGSPADIGDGKPVLAVAAGNTVAFWGGDRSDAELKRFTLPHNVASVALDLRGRKFVVGEEPGTWARVYGWDDGAEMAVLKGHHGPIWSIAFSPDGQLYATGSEDGTIKLWKNCEGAYGLWRASPTFNLENNAAAI